ncbi:dTDP-4-amino-4,6-dideoxygalactose transaminase [Paenibacillus filicis]|uniref:dTDP-4-amino-4,6-dideoxygalactose transaminase n=1 Tax=Paenibacillus gyeongsangnamensis TaxID=3388067 RepID=A0ABT4QC19_9BACL|nr:dTDP-4-amino-4,6-dideoxygalactose transaminase [Paenibacillus filicis]MCZ8514433.1 dTDP-4-amino-4,6-dideoxygalactose transaminase [Paenibacillus filicis]
MIKFNVPAVAGKEKNYLKMVLRSKLFAGDNEFTKKCCSWLQTRLGCFKVLLTPSCTHALEMSAILSDIQPGDEVIMPSFTFVSTANAFLLRGAKIVFVDIRPDTQNIDEKLIEDAITERTKCIVVVHYAGVAAEMDAILSIAKRYSLVVVEDAAQAILSSYKGKPLGTFGQMGCLSFHETKNIHCGEGGAILLGDPELSERAEIIREKGTNRSCFFRGQVDKYSWVDIGSSYLLGELSAAFLYAQMEMAERIVQNRMCNWNHYYDGLAEMEQRGFLERPVIPDECIQNGHLFYIKAKSLAERTALIDYLAEKGIMTVFHYVPLHSSKAGQLYTCFHGEDRHTTDISERLLRLPLYYQLPRDRIEYIVEAVRQFYLNN